MIRNGLTALLALVCAGTGCAAHFQVLRDAQPPDQIPPLRASNPRLPVTLQIANFAVADVDTQYPPNEKEQFRRHFSVAIPNLLEEAVGEQHAVAEVRRTAIVDQTAADYIVYGEYSYYERLGTEPLGWVPLVALAGAPVTRRSVRTSLGVRVLDAQTGAEIFRRSYPEEIEQTTSMYETPPARHLGHDYLGRVAADVVAAIDQSVVARGSAATPGVVAARTVEAVPEPVADTEVAPVVLETEPSPRRRAKPRRERARKDAPVQDPDAALLRWTEGLRRGVLGP
jgi:hypothetical protein